MIETAKKRKKKKMVLLVVAKYACAKMADDVLSRSLSREIFTAMAEKTRNLRHELRNSLDTNINHC